MRTFCARSRAYDNDVIQLFWPFADFTQPIKLQKTLECTIVGIAMRMRTVGLLGDVSSGLGNVARNVETIGCTHRHLNI